MTWSFFLSPPVEGHDRARDVAGDGLAKGDLAPDPDIPCVGADLAVHAGR